MDTIYHEATYIDADKCKATARFHSTAAEAAIVAAKAGARRLVIGHYSKSYPDTKQHLAEAEAEAKKLGHESMVIIAADEGLTIDL